MAAKRPKIGRLIRAAMERKRMDQKQLARALGVSRSAVNAWINDRAWPMNSLAALEEVLGVRLGDRDPEPPPYHKLDAHTRRVLRAALPDDDDYERVVALLEGRLIVIEPGAAAPA